MLRKLFSLALNFRLQRRSGAAQRPRVVWPAFLNFPRGSLEIRGLFFAGRGLYLSTNEYCSVEIGDRVTIGPDVKILGGNHKMDYTGGHIWDFHNDNPVPSVIVIGAGAWIGANTVILDGAEIGEGCVVGAGSVVTGRLPPWTVAGGVPARKIRDRFESDDDLEVVLRATGSRLSVDDVLNG